MPSSIIGFLFRGTLDVGGTLLFRRWAMSRRALLVAVASLLGAAVAPAGCDCSSSSTSPSTDAGAPDNFSPPIDSGPAIDANAPLAIAPSSANVLTCSTLQLKETGGKGGGVWSVAPTTGAGSIDTTGDYTAPTISPQNPAVN